MRGLLDTLLVRKGYDLVLASNGRKGLDLFRREHPSAVVLGRSAAGAALAVSRLT